MEEKYTNPQRTGHRDHHTTDTKDREHTRHISPPAVDSRKEYRNRRPAQENSEKTKAAPRIVHVTDHTPLPPIAYTNITDAKISPS